MQEFITSCDCCVSAANQTLRFYSYSPYIWLISAKLYNIPWGLLHCVWILTSSPKRPQHPYSSSPASPAPLAADTVPTDAYGMSFLLPCPANPTSVMNFFLRTSRPSGNGVVYLGYLSEQFLEGLPDTHQPNVVEKVGHKPGIQ